MSGLKDCLDLRSCDLIEIPRTWGLEIPWWLFDISWDFVGFVFNNVLKYVENIFFNN